MVFAVFVIYGGVFIVLGGMSVVLVPEEVIIKPEEGFTISGGVFVILEGRSVLLCRGGTMAEALPHDSGNQWRTSSAPKGGGGERSGDFPS